MREIIADVERWMSAGVEGIATATVLKTYGSAPRGVGGKLAVARDGRISGSISGGCVESAIIDEGIKLSEDSPPRILHFETSNESAWEVGLPCGGTIDVLLENLDRTHYQFVKRCIDANRWARTVTVVDSENGSIGRKLSFDDRGTRVGGIAPEDATYEARIVEVAGGMTDSGEIELDDGVQLFVEAFSPTPTLILVGGVHIAIALVGFARILGYRTVVIDPRRTFGSAERFPNVDRLIQEWPELAFEDLELTRETAVVVLTHDPKLDDPALKRVLESPARYIGALGSNKTQAGRKQRLLAMGFGDEELSRIHGPVGVDIDASSPEEIALSIITEIVALSHHSESVLRVSDFALNTERTERSIPS